MGARQSRIAVRVGNKFIVVVQCVGAVGSSIRVLLVEGAADDQTTNLKAEHHPREEREDLGGAGADLVEFRVADIAASGKLVHVAVAAEDLQGVQADLRRPLRRLQKHRRRVLNETNFDQAHSQGGQRSHPPYDFGKVKIFLQFHGVGKI